MRLSELHEQIRSAPQDILECGIYLAAPDMVEGDNVDVFVAGIGKIDVDLEKNRITLAPASTIEPPDDAMPILSVQVLLERIPSSVNLWGDFELLVELPLDRDTASPVLKSIASVTALHVGQHSGEAWLLVAPVAEYPEDVLPE